MWGTEGTKATRWAPRWTKRRLGRDRGPERVGRLELRSTLLVEHIEFADGEACSCQQVDDLPSEMAPSENALLDRLESVLPATHGLVGGQTCLLYTSPSPRDRG